MLRIRKIMKETRNIRCASCGRPGTAIKDAQLGWIFEDPGWALINYQNICSVCTEKIVSINKAENDKNHEKWLETKGE